MSLPKTIFDNIDNTIKLYISQVASQYKINENDLYKMWNSNGEIEKNYNVIQNKTEVIDEVDPELMKLGKKELIELCKTKKLTVGGSKIDLVKRIMGVENKNNTSRTSVMSGASVTNTKSLTKSSHPEIIKKIVEKIPTIQIKRNSHGNFEHTDSGLVINNISKKAYGRQNKDGTIAELTPGDIDLCHKYKFAYDIPENLNKKTNIDDDDEEDDELEEVDDEAEAELEDEIEDEDDEEELDDDDDEEELDDDMEDEIEDE